MIAGVCGGLAEYLGVDSVIVRLAFVAFSLAGGSGLLAYIILAIVIPEAPAGAIEEAEPMELEAARAERRRRARDIAGVLVLALGLGLLAQQAGWLPWRISGDVLWPLALIALGVLLIIRRPNQVQ